MYTKGEWKVVAEDTSFVVTDKNGCELVRTKRWSEIDQANAQLIASAPDLYEACKEARDYLSFNKGNASPIYDKLNEALAKAGVK